MTQRSLSEMNMPLEKVIELSDDEVARLNNLHIDQFPPYLRKGHVIEQYIEIVEDDNYRRAVAKTEVPQRVVVLVNDGVFVSRPLRYSIQVGIGLHRIGVGGVEHSCTPNSHIDFPSHSVVTDRKLISGEVVTINYLLTEERISSPFYCNSEYDIDPNKCFGLIRGYNKLSEQQKRRLHKDPNLAPYLNGRI